MNKLIVVIVSLLVSVILLSCSKELENDKNTFFEGNNYVTVKFPVEMTTTSDKNLIIIKDIVDNKALSEDSTNNLPPVKFYIAIEAHNRLVRDFAVAVINKEPTSPKVVHLSGAEYNNAISACIREDTVKEIRACVLLVKRDLLFDCKMAIKSDSLSAYKTHCWFLQD